jgi:hypothetical protein
MAILEKLRAFHAETEALRDEANAHAGLGEELYYDRCYSGPTDRVDALFCGINPGFGSLDWPSRSVRSGHRELVPSPCKYIEEFSEGFSLGEAIVEVVFDGDASRLGQCAETNLRSFFATPNQGILAGQLNRQSPGWRNRHDNMMSSYIDFLSSELRPRRFICFGVGVFDQIVAMMQLKPDEASFAPDLKRRFFLKSEIAGIPFYGLIHLSGGRPSNAMKDWLRSYFADGS